MKPTFALKPLGFILGLSLFIIILSLPVFPAFLHSAQLSVQASGASVDPVELASSMQSVFALFLLMVIWWIGEAVPLPIAALLPAHRERQFMNLQLRMHC